MERSGKGAKKNVNTWAVQIPPVMLKPFQAIFLAA
jgi:hypothetical protein